MQLPPVPKTAFSSSHEYLFNHLGSWQTFSSVSLAFNSTFLTLLQQNIIDFICLFTTGFPKKCHATRGISYTDH